MNISIRSRYRIVKSNQEKGTVYVPQYQEEGSKDWHTFKKRTKGLCGGYNTTHFNSLGEAVNFLTEEQKTQDQVVLQTPRSLTYEENSEKLIREKYLRTGLSQTRG